MLTRVHAPTERQLRYLIFGILLLILGFLADGVMTEPGHHAAMILGGILIGYGASR